MILNLTQHRSTPEQTAVGVVDLSEPERTRLAELLDFPELPTERDVVNRALAIAQMAQATGHTQAMVGGAPFLMSPLVKALHLHGVQARFAFSLRESTEQVQPDGSVRKVSVFRHVGFVPASL